MALGIQFYPEQCLRSIHRSSKCSLCVDACPTHAIDFKTLSPQLDSLKCVSCGGCVVLCPTDVYEAKDPSDEDIIRFIEEKQRENLPEIVFTCKQVQTNEPHFMELPCLARMDASLLLLCCTNATSSVKLIHNQCAKCHSSSLETMFEEAVRYVKHMQPNAQIRLLTLDKHVVKKDETLVGITKNGYLRRRMLFSLFGKKPSSKEAEILTVQHPMVFQDNIHQQRSFKKHQRLKRFIAFMQGSSSPESGSVIVRTKPVIDPLKCKECSICTKVCPTGALCINEEKEFCIDYTSDKCIVCHMCEDVCFANAIMFAPQTMSDMLKNEPSILFEKDEVYHKKNESVVIFRT